MSHLKLTKYLLRCISNGKKYNPDAKIVQWATQNGYNVDEQCRWIIAEFDAMANRQQ